MEDMPKNENDAASKREISEANYSSSPPCQGVSIGAFVRNQNSHGEKDEKGRQRKYERRQLQL